MKISTKGRYALYIMLDLAIHRDTGFIPLKNIAERQGISKNYMEQIMLLLNRSDFLLTNRGAQGGYKLAKSPEMYRVGDILRLTERTLIPTDCAVSDTGCSRGTTCMVREVWCGLHQVMQNYLDSLTLRDILDGATLPSTGKDISPPDQKA